MSQLPFTYAKEPRAPSARGLVAEFCFDLAMGLAMWVSCVAFALGVVLCLAAMLL